MHLMTKTLVSSPIRTHQATSSTTGIEPTVWRQEYVFTMTSESHSSSIAIYIRDGGQFTVQTVYTKLRTFLVAGPPWSPSAFLFPPEDPSPVPGTTTTPHTDLSAPSIAEPSFPEYSRIKLREDALWARAVPAVYRYTYVRLPWNSKLGIPSFELCPPFMERRLDVLRE